jgi:hypothetical protein
MSADEPVALGTGVPVEKRTDFPLVAAILGNAAVDNPAKSPERRYKAQEAGTGLFFPSRLFPFRPAVAAGRRAFSLLERGREAGQLEQDLERELLRTTVL